MPPVSHSLQHDFQALAVKRFDAETSFGDGACQDMLGELNVALENGLARFTAGLRSAKTTLPNGAELVAWEYEALEELAKSNGADFDKLLAGVFITDTHITRANFDASGLRNIRPLAGLSRLQKLDLNGNGITDLEALGSLAGLHCLGLNRNRIADLTPLSGLAALTNLYLHDNSIRDLSPIAGLTELRSLGLNRNHVTDLTALSSLSKLCSLWLHGNRPDDLTPLSCLPRLRWLCISAGYLNLPGADVIKTLKARIISPSG